MAKNDNLKDFLTDIADAIRAKKGTTDKINPQDFSAEIASIETSGGGGTSSGWTGHADAEGLRAIGWTDEDIAYYQENGVNWNAEDDEYHKVTDDNKALYGVLTADNISSYRDRIVYLPKIDIGGTSNRQRLFEQCAKMIAIPFIETQGVRYMNGMFQNCYALVCVPPFDTQNVIDFSYMFYGCYSLVTTPKFDVSHAYTMSGMFQYCYSLVTCSLLFNKEQTIDNVGSMFAYCYSLNSISEIYQASSVASSFYGCSSLVNCKLHKITKDVNFGHAISFSKESLLYIINNEAATSAITITLHSYAYERLANDADIVEALTNHPNISLAK